METSLMVTDYPEPPEEKTKEVSGNITIKYRFKYQEVPADWDREQIIQDIKDNLYDYIDDATETIEEIEIN